MNKYFKKIILLFLIFLLNIFVSLSSADETKVISQKEHSSFIQFIKNLFKNNIESSTTIKTTYDSNIFLTEDSEDSDIIHTLTQYVTFKAPKDPFYFQVDYTGNLSYYIEEGDNIHDHTSNAIFSYRPFNNFSLGIGNYFRKVYNKKITTVFGDRLISRGYKEDTPTFEVKLEPTKRLRVDAGWKYYALDADSPTDDYIDRGDNIGIISFNYEFRPDLIGFLGHRYQDAHFPHLSTKDAESSRVFFGFTKKIPDFCNLSLEVGQEHKHTSYLKDDANTDLKIKLNSTFSVYTIFNVALNFNGLEPSARKEYFQYFINSIDVGLRHMLNPKTTIFVTSRYERQKFDSSDILTGNSAVDKSTDVISFGAGLKRNLNDWLSFNLGYSYIKRNTDFVNEGYTDNKISFGLTANY
jgi:hypothetical protein